MRLKEFLYFLLFFTIAYFLFWGILDLYKKRKNKAEKLAKVDITITTEKYIAFASFYGIQSSLSKYDLITIYKDVEQLSDYRISYFADKYHISSLEFTVVILFLEYYGLINSKEVFMESDCIKNCNNSKNNYLKKYNSFFSKKATLAEIESKVGQTALEDLMKIDNYYLYPGVRFIGNELIYLGDSYEEKED